MEDKEQTNEANTPPQSPTPTTTTDNNSEDIGNNYDVIEIEKVIELSCNRDVTDTVTHDANHDIDTDMDAIVPHERLNTEMLKYKANIANQRARKPPSRCRAQNRLTMQPAAFEFFDIDEFLEGNFEKSRKEIQQNSNIESCQMRERKGLDVEPSKRNRYSMPPVVQARNFGLTNNNLLQSKQRLGLRSKPENDDSDILRRKRITEYPRDETLTKISEHDPSPRSVLRNVTNRGDLKNTNESPTEMRNSTPEFLLHAQRVRKSWIEPNGNRIEKLLTENRHSDGPVNKRHSIAVSNMAAKFGEYAKSPKPKVMPKPRSPKKLESGLTLQQKGLKPIIPDAPKCKEAQVEETKEKSISKIEILPTKIVTPKETPKTEIKEVVTEPIKDNSDTPKPRIRQVTPAKPSLPPLKPTVLPSKPPHLSPVKKSPYILPQKCEDNKQVVEEVTSPQQKDEVFKPNDIPRQIKSRPPIAIKPTSLHRVKSDTELSRISIKSKFANKSTSSSRINYLVDDENQKKKITIEVCKHKNENSTEEDNNKSQKPEDKQIESNENDTENNDNNNRKLSTSPQQKSYNRPITPKNGTTTTERSPITKEKPIFAFLKAKEATDQQSYYTGSELNRTFISSGLGTSAKVFLNSKDSMQEFGNSKQSKIITY